MTGFPIFIEPFYLKVGPLWKRIEDFHNQAQGNRKNMTVILQHESFCSNTSSALEVCYSGSDQGRHWPDTAQRDMGTTYPPEMIREEYFLTDIIMQQLD